MTPGARRPALSPEAFRPVRRASAPHAIVTKLRDLIVAGRLAPGDRLPAERELAATFQVGRGTVREALRVVEALGLVEVRAGGGTFVTAADHDFPILPADVVAAWTLRHDLFELRAMLEPELAGLAARRVTAGALQKMRAALEAQAAQVARGASGMDEDEAFHALVAEAAGNPAVTRLMASVAHRLHATRDAALQRNGRPCRSLEQNQGVLAAIDAQNPALATRRMRAHIRSIARVLFAPGVRPPDARQAPGGGGDDTP